MCNRLELEFPEVAWRALPPTGPGRVPPEVMRQCLDRGRELRAQAVRRSLRAGGAAVVRRLGALIALSRRLAHRRAGQRCARGAWVGPAHGI